MKAGHPRSPALDWPLISSCLAQAPEALAELILNSLVIHPRILILVDHIEVDPFVKLDLFR
jgi:hypothetical protein